MPAAHPAGAACPAPPAAQDSLPTSLLKLNVESQSRAVKMFNSILHYMGVHGEVLANMQSLELAQKLLHQGLKRADMRDELFMQVGGWGWGGGGCGGGEEEDVWGMRWV